MNKLKLALFALDHTMQYGLWKAGADMAGGTTRRHRADAHRNLAAQALHHLLGRPGTGMRPECEPQKNDATYGASEAKERRQSG